MLADAEVAHAIAEGETPPSPRAGLTGHNTARTHYA
jgi:hypothetical protein